MIHLDTSYLVDLLRETKRSVAGPATAMAHQLFDQELWISPVVICELFAGAENAQSPAEEYRWVDQVLSAVQTADLDRATAHAFGRTAASLRAQGLTVAPLDLLIGCTALAHEAPLVTGNVKHFSQIPDLRLLPY